MIEKKMPKSNMWKMSLPSEIDAKAEKSAIGKATLLSI
jgi:hypothetical protein